MLLMCFVLVSFVLSLIPRTWTKNLNFNDTLRASDLTSEI